MMEKQKVTTIEGRGVGEVETILEDMILKMKQQFDESLNVPKISKEVELSKEIRKLIECLATVRRTSGNLLEVGVIELNPQLIAPQQIFTQGVKGVCYPENVKESIEEVTEIEVLLTRKIKKILKKYDLKGEDVKLAFHMAFEMYKRDKDINFIQSEYRDYQRTNSKIQNDPVKIYRLREVFLASQEIADIFIETNLPYSYTEYVVNTIQRQQYVMK